MGNNNLNNSGTPGRIATKLCTDVVLAHRYRTTSIVRYRHLREPRKLSWNFPITDYSFRVKFLLDTLFPVSYIFEF